MQKNRIELAGYLAAKPELRYLPSGTKVANARLGESHRYRGKDGQVQTHTNWHSLTFYDELADVAVSYEQGDNLYVEGTIQQRKFTPKDGATRTVHEVIVRACHVIEPSRTERFGRETVEDLDALGPAEGEAIDASWPV
jgi:single-strand DNA-binding protein